MGLLLIILVIGFVLWLLLDNGHLTGRTVRTLPTTDRPETPLELLEKRYARGEIDRTEFEEIKRSIA
ncbi:MAG: SHOCT domain-containing protein [Actinomycetota bacterium]